MLLKWDKIRIFHENLLHEIIEEDKYSLKGFNLIHWWKLISRNIFLIAGQGNFFKDTNPLILVEILSFQYNEDKISNWQFFWKPGSQLQTSIILIGVYACVLSRKNS